MMDLHSTLSTEGRLQMMMLGNYYFSLLELSRGILQCSVLFPMPLHFCVNLLKDMVIGDLV